jgi:hypothetical protein
VIGFHRDSPDEKAALEYIINKSKEDDIELKIHKVVKAEIDWPYVMPQKPIAKTVI